MHKHAFQELRSHLLKSGISPGHVRRITSELRDHVEDLRLEALDSKLTADEAEAYALGQIGDQRIIAQRIPEHTESKTWVYRYPRIACIYLPIAYALLLLASPDFAGMANPSIVVRWGAALMLGGVITAAMFLGMQLAIILT
jgi:hypothetical protein